MLTNTTGGLLTPPPLKKYALFLKKKRGFSKIFPTLFGAEHIFLVATQKSTLFHDLTCR